MRTSVKGVWAIGDCIGDPRAPKLAHGRVHAGRGRVDTILGEEAAMDYDVVPNVVYTHPEPHRSGLRRLSEEKYGDEVKVARSRSRRRAARGARRDRRRDQDRRGR